VSGYILKKTDDAYISCKFQLEIAKSKNVEIEEEVLYYRIIINLPISYVFTNKIKMIKKRNTYLPTEIYTFN